MCMCMGCAAARRRAAAELDAPKRLPTHPPDRLADAMMVPCPLLGRER